ncbi:MAG: hypothetical protein Q9183_000350 [Haloplaca sp. 2 TL-2023]
MSCLQKLRAVQTAAKQDRPTLILLKIGEIRAFKQPKTQAIRKGSSEHEVNNMGNLLTHPLKRGWLPEPLNSAIIGLGEEATVNAKLARQKYERRKRRYEDDARRGDHRSMCAPLPGIPCLRSLKDSTLAMWQDRVGSLTCDPGGRDSRRRGSRRRDPRYSLSPPGLYDGQDDIAYPYPDAHQNPLPGGGPFDDRGRPFYPPGPDHVDGFDTAEDDYADYDSPNQRYGRRAKPGGRRRQADFGGRRRGPKHGPGPEPPYMTGAGEDGYLARIR